MCEQCCTNAVLWDEIVPGWALMLARRDGTEMKAGQWGLVRCNDPDVIFSQTPMTDPFAGMTDEEIDCTVLGSELFEAANEFDSGFAKFSVALKFDPWVGHELIKAGISAGFDRERDGSFAFWLFHRLGQRLAQEPVESKQIQQR